MTKASNPKFDLVAPDPAALIESLRSVGYSLPTAVADIVDNSIAAKSKNIHITFHWSGKASYVYILDDGCGMDETTLRAAMRPGSCNPINIRKSNDLGRFGLGLKTASLSQCRNLSVASKPCNGSLNTRTWDLDALAGSTEWRLLHEPPAVASTIIIKLLSMPRGTAVIWSSLDRLVGDVTVGDSAAHSRFNYAIDEVRDHLSLTFHRFLEDKLVKIYLNEKPIVPWNPFMMDSTRTVMKTPEEPIPFGKSTVKFQGFILPHKNDLTEDEFRKYSGPRGWTAQQGFYVYREKRLLIYGDWLRLGRPSVWTRAEHYRLARIRIDISNDTDAEWHLDIKKSTARPPAIIRERLTDLAERVREDARGVFAHRGKYGPRDAILTKTERPWLSIVREKKRVYSINREHPSVQAVTATFPSKIDEINTLLRILEETVPVEQIWLDTAEQSCDHGTPYTGIDFSVIKADMRCAVNFFVKSGINRNTAIERLRVIEPFNHYPRLINEL
jgi:hypothetical protein